MNLKERAAAAALQYVKSGMTLGLGTGSTAKVFIDLLGAEIKAGRLTGIRGVPTSNASDDQAKSLGIEIIDFSKTDFCDVTIDGADEIDPQLNVVKGLGGALLREKVVAQHTKKLIIIADESKIVTQLGTKQPLPVEITPFAKIVSEKFLKSLGCTPTLRLSADGSPYVTDNANYIFDCRFQKIDDPAALDRQLRSRAGIVETGLFVGIAAVAIVGKPDGVDTLTK